MYLFQLYIHFLEMIFRVKNENRRIIKNNKNLQLQVKFFSMLKIIF